MTKHLSFLFSLVSSILFASLAYAGTFYVSTSGSGTTCSFASPCALSRIQIAAVAGDIWVLKNGTYSGSGSVLSINGATANDGTSGSHIRVTSEDPTNCVSAATCAVLQGNGAAGHVLNVQAVSYWDFDNIVVRNLDNSGNTGSNASILGTFNVTNITFRKMVFADNNTWGNNDAVLLQGTNILIEDSDILRSHRNYIACYPGTTSNVTIRRVYISQPVTFHGTNYGPGDGYVYYTCPNSINENSIAEDLVGYGFTGWGDNNSVRGGIALNNNAGLFNGTASSTADPGYNFTANDFLGISNNGTCAYFRPSAVYTIDGFSCFNNHIVADDTNPGGNGVTSFAITIRNAMVQNTPGGASGYSVDSHGLFATKLVEFSRDYNTGGVNGGWSTSNITTTDPTMGSCRVWVPLTSNMKGNGKSGADIGANIIYATEDGVLTANELWNATTGKMRYGPPIVSGVNDTSTGHVRDNVGVRLNITASGCLPSGYGAVVRILVAAYGFDELSGSSAVDASGNGNTGTLGSGATRTVGKYGRSILFDGTINAVVTVPDSSTLDLTSGMTLGAWLYPTATHVDFRAAIVKNYVYYMYASVSSYCGAGGIFGGIDPSSSVCSATPLVINTWTYLTVTYDGTNLRLYRDGVLVDTQSSSAITTSSDNFMIGSSVWGDESFEGRIDSVRVYNYARSATASSGTCGGVKSEIECDRDTPINVMTVSKPPRILSIF